MESGLPGMVLDASMGVMSCLLIQCSCGFGFPEGAGQLREQGLLHWANLWHFHLPHMRVHVSILHLLALFYMLLCNSSLPLYASGRRKRAACSGWLRMG